MKKKNIKFVENAIMILMRLVGFLKVRVACNLIYYSSLSR